MLRNDYLIRLYRKYATDGIVDKTGVREILVELDSLIHSKDKKEETELDMTDLQFE